MRKAIYTTILAGALMFSSSVLAQDEVQALEDAPKVENSENKKAGGDKQGKFMSKIDTDGDGQVSQDEFLSKHKEHFATADSNGDGFLTMEEIKQARQAKKSKFGNKLEGARGSRGNKEFKEKSVEGVSEE